MLLNFKSRADVLPSALILGSILILLGTLAYMILVPMPSAAGVARVQERNRQQLQSDIQQAKTRAGEAKQAAAARSWQGTPDSVMAVALARLTQQAAQHHLQIAAFRPQKPQAVSGMTELPFTVQVAGPYPAVLAFLGSLDAPANKMALRSLQVASADASTSTVTATAGLSAYLADGGAAAGVVPASGTGRSSAAAAPAVAAAAGGSRG